MYVVQGEGFVRVDRATDEAFRHALKHGAPTHAVRAKFNDALTGRFPQANARQFSQQHFGAENLARIVAHVDPLIFTIDKLLHGRGLSGFVEWLKVTGWANDYKMIKAFEAWADHLKEKAENGTGKSQASLQAPQS